ncbi:unnamed protein product [Chilo suppressalis]|uniref:ADP-ribosylation factor-related protein 1 n=1 Tax=Chilo suppressalis TaxID=168631 RepID=A0ABN8BCW9_CHISP|nr:unnamed protein product [Chilo suppressalis]
MERNSIVYGQNRLKALLTYLEATKTKYTKKYKAMNPNRITTTVGLNIGKIHVDGVILNFWDLGGQQELQSLWDKYYAECHAVIYIVDSSDRERISESKETFDRMIASEHLSGVPLLVLANKQDIPDCMGLARTAAIGRRDEIPPFYIVFNRISTTTTPAPLPQIFCVPFGNRISAALSKDGVDEGIRWLVDCIKRNSVDRPPRNHEDNL